MLNMALNDRTFWPYISCFRVLTRRHDSITPLNLHYQKRNWHHIKQICITTLSSRTTWSWFQCVIYYNNWQLKQLSRTWNRHKIPRQQSSCQVQMGPMLDPWTLLSGHQSEMCIICSRYGACYRDIYHNHPICIQITIYRISWNGI